MMHTRRHFARAMLVLWLVYGVLSYLFTTTKGLAYRDANKSAGISLVRDMQSSGGNDNICIELGIVFACMAFIWGMLRIKTNFKLADIAVYSALLVLQALFILSIEMGSIVDTVLYGRNFVLALWVIIYFMLCGSIVGKAVFSCLQRKEGSFTL